MLSKSEKRLILTLRRSRKRSKENLVLVEGIRTVDEALSAHMEISFCVLSPKLSDTPKGKRLAERIGERLIEVRNLSDTELDTISDTENSQGILMVCVEPMNQLSHFQIETTATVLIVDGVQDPGNLGTLIRAAKAFDISAVISLEDTVDFWNPKVVRASAGTIFHSHVFSESWSDTEVWLREHSMTVLAADVKGTDIAKFHVDTPWALIVGNENKGIRPRALGASKRISIPMSRDVDSLNAAVAGSTLLYLLTNK
jgi:TrmH family RNA methyltransferase|tara:strand:+ start:230 stop:997 length:768 start_codon:yes stop_codon:yes gene_type:complete